MAFSGSDAGGFRWEGFDSGAPSQQKPPKPQKPRKQIKSPAARVLTNIAVTLAAGFLYFYFELPALNLPQGARAVGGVPALPGQQGDRLVPGPEAQAQLRHPRPALRQHPPGDLLQIRLPQLLDIAIEKEMG